MDTSIGSHRPRRSTPPSLTRFEGRCEPLIEVDVDDLIDWIDGIDRSTWPDWGKGDFRPAVVNEPTWEGLENRTQPVVDTLLALFPGCHDAYRSITTVHPGDYVPAHTDTLSPGWITRVHVPILTNEGCFIIVDDVRFHLEVGLAYRVNPGRPHAVVNGGSSTRIHLMFDVIQ